VRVLLRQATDLGAYVPVDISAAFLAVEADRLRREFPDLSVLPVAADFTRPFELPPGIRDCPRVGFFPGSTIGNFEPEQACDFLRLAARLLGSESTIIVGVDLEKDLGILEAAYSDAAGVTAEFNRNVLARANRELGANFDVKEFEHYAFYNTALARIEMHLVSRRQQFVRVLGGSFTFAEGESIHTENSYKYTAESFSALAHQGGWETTAILEDPSSLFALHVLRTGVG
jgi:dimethylhistidine N-methyltransferase